jgi:SAM-dependent methyltransferase
LRLVATLKLGYYPLPLMEAERLRRFLVYPPQAFAALDPCIGDGTAFIKLTEQAEGYRYGIELDTYRARQARAVTNETIHGSCFDAQCPVESFSLIYCNPPYSSDLSETHTRRMEVLFLEHTYRWLKPGGVLVLVIPGARLAECNSILASHFRDTRFYRLTAPESVRYKQVVVFGIRRNRREREKLRDWEISEARLRYTRLSRNPELLAPLPSQADAQYVVPPADAVRLVHRGLPLDEIENQLVRSAAYRQARPVLFAEPANTHGRPLTPLHGGHLSLLAVSSMLDGIFGEGEDLHVSSWRSVKHIQRSEEQEDGVVTIREREYFSSELTLIFSSGKIAILK